MATARPLSEQHEELDIWLPRWRMVGAFAGVILLLYPLDWLILGQWSPEPLWTRIAWSTELMLYLVLWRGLGPRWEQRLRSVHIVATTCCFLALVVFTGAHHSPYLDLMPSVPLVVALAQPRDGRPALLSGLTCTLGVLGLFLGMDRAIVGLGWALLTGSATFFGMYGAAQYNKVRDAEHALSLERARREDLEKLALAERQRAQTEKLATVGRLAASVVHEINNPLAFVRSNLDFLRAEVLQQPLGEEARGELGEVFEETRQGIERIRQIVADLKGFSHMDMEGPTECALAEVVTDAARLAGVRLKNVARLTVDLSPELPGVYATPRRLAQVVLNLLVNAGDALEEARVPGAEVRITGRSEGRRVALLVEDNGPGFPPDVLPRLFESFFTTKGPDKGTGLGLSLSREWVERCGGTLVAENRPEGGARLRLELPMYASTPGVG